MFSRLARVARPAVSAARFNSSVPALTLSSAAGPVSTDELFSGKKVVVVGVVGAFTSVCDGQVPAFNDALPDLKAKGVDSVAVVTVNDPAVTAAWAKSLDLADAADLSFIADWDAAFTKAVGQDIDLSAVGFGVRSQRYSMVVDDGTITSVDVEESPGNLDVSSAESTLGRL